MEGKRADLFIKIDEYKDILDIINLIQQKIRHSRELLNKIEELKAQEDSQIEEWRGAIDDVDKKMTFIDQVLLEPETY